MLVLSKTDIQQLVPMRDAIELMKTAFRELSEDRAQAPIRAAIDVDKASGTMLLMPAYVPASDALGFKMVSVFPTNVERGLPTINALVCLVNEATGVPAAIMHGAYLTALRTGAVSGAATDLLARADASRLVVIGAGAQGVTQAAAVAAVRPIEQITVVSRTEATLERFRTTVAAEWPELADRLHLTTDGRGSLAEADVVCAATTSATPVFADVDLPEGVHVNGVGAFKPEMQELPTETMQRGRVFVDQREAAFEEAGDLLIPMQQGVFDESMVAGELGELVSGAVPGRTDDAEVTVFKSVGNAVQDVVVARQAVDRASRKGHGQQVSLD